MVVAFWIISKFFKSLSHGDKIFFPIRHQFVNYCVFVSAEDDSRARLKDVSSTKLGDVCVTAFSILN